MNKNSNLPEVILRVELLRKGDVLLSRGRDPKSEVIAKFSGGQFSHAALCVSPQMTFESDMGVIGHRLIHILGTADVGKDRTTVGEAPGQPEYCAVYRHPMMSSGIAKEVCQGASAGNGRVLRKGLFGALPARGAFGFIGGRSISGNASAALLGEKFRKNFMGHFARNW